MSRKDARAWTMKLIYEMTMNDFDPNEVEDFLKYHRIVNDEKEYLTMIMDAFFKHQEEIDEKIGSLSRDWKINRISKIDLSILRLATTEIMYIDEIPISVSANEAVELSKEYSTEKSFKFINGILATLIKEQLNENI